jgi:Ni/Fe-hydrogenase subunit HybB-like protein
MNIVAREASIRPFKQAGLRWWLAVVGLTLVVLTGVAAWVLQLKGGMGAAGYNDHAFWAIYIADVITFIGVSYGGAVVSAILRLTGATWRAPLTRLAEGTAVVTVLIGSALIIPHIGNPIRLWELLARPNVAAPVFWDFIAVQTYTFASIVFFCLPLVPDMAALHSSHAKRLGKRRATLYAHVSKGWVGAPRQRRVLAGALGLVSIMIIPLAVSVHSVLAWAFATTSRPWWHESIWAPQFVVAALYSGVALVILVVAGFRKGYKLEALIHPRHFVRLGFILATFAATYLYFTFADLLPGAYVADHPTSSVFTELILGRMAPYFWMFLVVGGVIPLLLVAMPWTRNVKGMVIASLCVVPMLWLKRILMITGGGTYDVMTGAFGRYHFTWIPVAITLAATAAIPLLLMLLFKVVPLVSIDEIEEIEEMEELEKLKWTDSVTADKAAEPVNQDTRLVGATRASHRMAGGAGALLLVALLSVAGVKGASPAQADTAPAAPVASASGIVLSGIETNGSVQLTALIFGSDGLPLASTPVNFSFATKQFGPKKLFAPLGSATSDAKGVAQLVLGGDANHSYKPTTKGPQEFAASAASKVEAEPVTSSTTVNVTAAKSAYTPSEPKLLAKVGHTMVYVLFGIVAAIWLTLIAQIIRLRRVCRVKASPSSA